MPDMPPHAIYLVATKVKERNTTVLAEAAATLIDSAETPKAKL